MSKCIWMVYGHTKSRQTHDAACFLVNKVMFTQKKLSLTMAEDDGYLEVLRWIETAVLENSEVRQWQKDNVQTAQLIAQREKALHRSRFLYDSVHG